MNWVQLWLRTAPAWKIVPRTRFIRRLKRKSHFDGTEVFKPATLDLNKFISCAKKTPSVAQDFIMLISLEVWPRCHQRETQHYAEEVGKMFGFFRVENLTCIGKPALCKRWTCLRKVSSAPGELPFCKGPEVLISFSFMHHQRPWSMDVQGVVTPFICI